MTTEPTPAEIRSAIVNTLVHATMPDGAPISSWVKTETILHQLGITDCPPALAQLIAIGISERARFAKRRWVREEAERRTREIQGAADRGRSNARHERRAG